MSENIISVAENYSAELDKVLVAKSATAFFADNALRTKFVGAKTVMIPEVDFDGLANYDRSTGFKSGAVNVGHKTYTMAMDRARSFSVDREDMDESGIASLAGKILGEYVRTKVVPECDAYVISKIASVAKNRGNVIANASMDEAYSIFADLISEVQSTVGYDEEVVCFVDSTAYSALCTSEEFSRMLTVSDFKQGELTIKVKKINGVTIIPVVSERMRSAYNFDENGFSTAETFSQIHMLALPKSAAHLVKKTEKMRVFTPEQNTNADAYKFDYRIYYDVFVKESSAEAIWTWESGEISLVEDKEDFYFEVGFPINIDFELTAPEGAKISYEWYECSDANRHGAILIQNDIRMLEHQELKAGTYYYYCKIKIEGMAPIYGRVYEVKIV